MSAQNVEIAGRQIAYVEDGGGLWLSHKARARLPRTTTQNIVMHLQDLRVRTPAPVECTFVAPQVEGVRTVRRRIKHVSLATAAAVSLRARRFEEFNALLALGRVHKVRIGEIRVNAIKERDFGDLLHGLLSGITPILQQFRVGRHRIDFMLPELGLAVEYDEPYHHAPQQIEADGRRQSLIMREHGFEFLRVRQGAEVRGLREVLKLLLEVRKKDATVGSR